MWIMAIIAAAQQAMQAINQIQQNNQQAKEIAQQNQANADERMRVAKKQMQQQKTSFLKGGVYFDSGSANSIINETYTTAKKDVKDMNKDSILKQKNLIRANGWTLLSGTASAAGEAYDKYNSYKDSSQNKNYTVGTKASNNSMKNKASGWSDNGTMFA